MGCDYSSISPEMKLSDDSEILKKNTNFDFEADEINLLKLVWSQVGNHDELGIEIMKRYNSRQVIKILNSYY